MLIRKVQSCPLISAVIIGKAKSLIYQKRISLYLDLSGLVEIEFSGDLYLYIISGIRVQLYEILYVR